MSVFTFDTRADNPVTTGHLDAIASELGVKIADSEKESYRTLLAVYHESVESLMALPEYHPAVDLERFPRKNVHVPKPEDNELGAWAHRCEIRDVQTTNGGLLEGRTVALKDCIAIAGVPMSMGSSLLQSYIPKTDASVVKRLLQAGATVAGSAVCENMCHSATSHSAASGVVHNPYARGYSSGGSSSGCGALVGGNAVDMAIGADQGGSIRIPSAWCGIYGLKPTFGLIPYTGAGSNEPTNDHLGPMTRTLLDNALLLQAIAGTDGIDDRSFGSPTPAAIPKYHSDLLASANPKDLTGVKIGVIAESLNVPALDPRVLECFLAAVEKFKQLGATVEHVSIPMHSHGAAIWTGISKAGGAATKLGLNFGRRGYILEDLNAQILPLNQEKWDQLYPSTKNIILNGVYARDHLPHVLGHATNLSLKLRQDYDKALSEYTVLLAPNMPYVANSHAAVPFAAVSAENPAGPLDLMGKQVGMASNTAPFNQSGHPALAMPCGMLEIQEGPLAGSGVRLPVSLQVIGRWYGEGEVYKTAYAWEQSYDWKQL